jgi:hypothetical protein
MHDPERAVIDAKSALWHESTEMRPTRVTK